MMKDMQNVRICIKYCKENPSFLERSGKENKVGKEINNDDIEIFNNVGQNKKKVDDGFAQFSTQTCRFPEGRTFPTHDNIL